MASPIVTPTNELAQAAFEFATMNARKDAFAAISAIFEQLNIKLEDSILNALCDIEKKSFMNGYAMCDALRNVPAFGGD